MKAILFFGLVIFPCIIFSQVQIGQDINGNNEYNWSGYSVSLNSDGNIIAIGAPNSDSNGNNSGHVRVYINKNNIWQQIGTDIYGKAENDLSGFSVSLNSDGNILAIGAPENDDNGNNSGHVRVYRNKNNIWEQVGSDINGEVENDLFGYSVSLSSDGNIIAIGAPNHDGTGNNSGHVLIYQNINNIWKQIGDDINFKETNLESVRFQSGKSVSLSSDGSIVAIGAYGNNDNHYYSGNLRIFRNSNNNWQQIGKSINIEASNDFSGYSVSLSSNGDIVAIGVDGNDGNGYNSGHVRIYRNKNNIWEQIGNDINGEASRDYSGKSVSLNSNGSIIAIGAYKNDGYGIDSGHVRIYRNNNNVWEQIGVDINGEAENDLSGFSVSLNSSGNIVVIGAPNNDGDGINSGHARVYDLRAVLSLENSALSYVNIYPNPASINIKIHLNNSELNKVSIFNNLGQLIKRSKKLTINTSNLKSGIYFLQVETNTGKTIKKLVIE